MGNFMEIWLEYSNIFRTNNYKQSGEKEMFIWYTLQYIFTRLSKFANLSICEGTNKFGNIFMRKQMY